MSFHFSRMRSENYFQFRDRMAAKNIVVTGSSGQVGSELRGIWHPDGALGTVFLDRKALDLRFFPELWDVRTALTPPAKPRYARGRS